MRKAAVDRRRYTDQTLGVVLLDLRRWLIDEYGDTPGAMMLIDRAVVGYQDFIRIVGWILELTPRLRLRSSRSPLASSAQNIMLTRSTPPTGMPLCSSRPPYWIPSLSC